MGKRTEEITVSAESMFFKDICRMDGGLLIHKQQRPVKSTRKSPPQDLIMKLRFGRILLGKGVAP